MEKLPSTFQRIAAYIRRSRQDVVRERKTDQDTLAEQRELLTNLLGSQQLPYEVYEEIGSGDSIEDRPVFKGLLDSLSKVKPRTVALCVKEISRLGRGDMAQMGIIYNLLREKQIFIITPFKIYDPLNDEDDLAIQFYLFVARVELQMTKRRLRESRYTYASQGRWMTGGGGIPFGYKFNPFTQKLEPDEKTEWVVKKIYHHYVHDRIGYNGISTIMRNEGISAPGGKPYFHPMTIRRILSNPTYKGELRFKTTQKVNKSVIKRPQEDWIVVKDAHPAIIDEALWEQAQATLGSNRSTPSVRHDFEPNPLAGLLTCGGCGKTMIRQSGTQQYKKKDGTVSTYRKEFIVCLGCRVYVKYKSVEQEIIRTLRDIIAPLDERELQTHITRLNEQDCTGSSMNPMHHHEVIQAELDTLKKELQQAVRLLTREIITEEEYQAAKLEIEQQLKEKEGLLASLQSNTHPDPIDLWNRNIPFTSVVDVYLYANLSKSGKNELLRGLFQSILLHFIRKGQYDLDMKLNSTLPHFAVHSAERTEIQQCTENKPRCTPDPNTKCSIPYR